MSFPTIDPTPEQVIELAQRERIEFIDLRFLDFPGLWQHLTLPVSELNPESFTKGYGFDGSSVRGWQEINEEDTLLVPVADTAVVDPFYQHPTLAMICDVKDPITKKQYSRDPRSVAKKAEVYLKQSGIADTAYFAPEMEFFLFDNVWYDQGINQAGYAVDSVEGIWNRGRRDGANLGNQVRQREGYFPMPPMDTTSNLRSEMVRVMQQFRIPVEGHHHEVATGGQGEVSLRHRPLLRMADICMSYKHIVKNVAARHGKVATFMPKPLYQDNGSGMHTHFSLWKDQRPLMAGRHYAGLSREGLHAIGGILRHAPALLAFTNPTTNSYKRLVPGYEAPVHLVYSSRNRATAIRVPVYSRDPDNKRVEFRCPDCSANPYLAFSAILMAALDGIRHEIDPGAPLDKPFDQLTPEELSVIPRTPRSLSEALDALEKDHDFLREGDVFTDDVIYYWIKYKREREEYALQERPHPYEFCMYFDI